MSSCQFDSLLVEWSQHGRRVSFLYSLLLARAVEHAEQIQEH